MQATQLRLTMFSEDVMTMTQVEAFITSKHATGRSESTLRFYRDTLSKFACFCPDWPPSINDVEGFLEYKRNTVSAATVRTYYRSLSAFMNWCERRGRLDSNPTHGIDKPSNPRRLPKAVSQDVLKRLFDTITEAAVTGDEIAIRDLALFRLVYDTGCRASEIASLRIDDLDVEYNTVIVRRGKGNNDRAVYFGDSAALALGSWFSIRPDCPWLFPSRLRAEARPLTRRGVYQALKRWSRVAGVKLTVHQIRHSYATHALRNGIDIEHVQHQMGHSDLSTTAIYLAADNPGRRLAHLEHSPGDSL